MNIDWSVFERRCSEDSVVAARWLQQCLDGERAGTADAPLRHALAQMSDRLLWHVGTRAQWLLHEAPAAVGGEGLAALTQAIADAQRERQVTLAAADGDTHKQALLGTLWEEYAALFHQAVELAPQPRLAGARRLLQRIDAAVEREPVTFLFDDLHEMRAMVADNAAGDCLALDRHAEAIALYEAAAAAVQRAAMPRKASAYRLKIVELHYSRATDLSSALTTLLELKDNEEFVIGPLTQVIVDRMLAEAYLRVGDAFEALAQVERVADGLDQLGYSRPGADIDAGLIERWIGRVDASTDGPVEFDRRLSQVLLTFMSCANIVGQLGRDETRRARAAAQVDEFTLLAGLFDQRRRAVAARDAGFMQSLPAPPGATDDASIAAPAAKSFDGTTLEELRRREQSGDVSDELQRALAAAIEDAIEGDDALLRDALRDVLADVLFTLDCSDEAAAIWRDSSQAALRRGDLGNYRYHAGKWLGALASGGDVAALSRACGEAIAATEARRYALATPNQQSVFIEQSMLFYQLGVFSAFKLDDHDLMLQRMDLAKAAGSVRDFARRQSAQPAPEADTLLQQIRRLEQRMGSAPSGLDAGRRRRLYDLWALRDGADAAHPEPLSLAAVQATLTADAAVLHYFWLPGDVLLVVAISGAALKVSRQLFDEAHMARLRSLVAQLDDMRRLELDQDELQHFLPLLVPQEVRPVLADTRRLRISPHGLLHVFPFHVLKIDGEYVFQRHAISYLPNLSALLLRLAERGGRGTLAIGVSRFRAAATGLPDLPAVATEIDALQAHYAEHDLPLEVWRDEAASVRRLRQALTSGLAADCRVWHIATHGEDVLDRKSQPMETRLFLADGAVDGLEIGSWRLRADLVILSVCHSGRRAYRNRLGEDSLNGDEMFGLPAAFFKAGARSVLGALWPAHDATTCELMTALHRHLRDHPPDVALQAAMREYLVQVTDAAACTGVSRDVVPMAAAAGRANPAFWAPFFLTQLGPLRD